ncbi:hypothetical protein GLS40_10080 [Pseudooceanicola sp. 216_PA32_1]|uniref:Uncharacterized protein n=1 Tax=Pseudooceanicola pacificus TaxID=2676438 RepID=A0A844W6J9_9RHOB|nr:hypothetical protein [Pseudooceanicola pacificus]MWB78374.1 hypothetical protein [Pseudooceanicola pacificus]
MRVIQPKGNRGSLKWLQLAVNETPHLLQPAGLPQIAWLSPLASDDYAEYRDGAFLERLGLAHLTAPLKEFWPQRGPQWDALGTIGSAPVLVEAKAHVREFLSPATQAGPESRAQIATAFGMVQADLGIAAPCDWTRIYYQYANRVAFLWWLRSQGIDAKLLFVSFLNDTEMNGPAAGETWDAMFAAANYALGLTGAKDLMRHVHHVMPDVMTIPEPVA